MLHFVFTGSESNVRHARLQTPQTRQAPQTPPQAFPRPQVSLVYTCYTLFLPVQKATLGTPASKPAAGLSKATSLAGIYMLHFVFTGSESNVKHAPPSNASAGLSKATSLAGIHATLCFYDFYGFRKQPYARPPSNPSNSSTSLSKARSFAGIHATLCFYRFRKQR